jgi:hypothetical protein
VPKACLRIRDQAAPIRGWKTTSRDETLRAERVALAASRNCRSDNVINDTLRILPLHHEFIRVHPAVSDNVPQLLEIEWREQCAQMVLAISDLDDRVDDGRRAPITAPRYAWFRFSLCEFLVADATLR